MVMHAWDLSTQEAEAGGLPRFYGEDGYENLSTMAGTYFILSSC